MINWRIASNPWNWLTVLLMFYIAMFGVDIVASQFDGKDNV